MTQVSLDQALRDLYRTDAADAAPAELRATVDALPDQLRGGLFGSRLMLVAVAGLLVALLAAGAVGVGSGLIPLPWVSEVTPPDTIPTRSLDPTDPAVLLPSACAWLDAEALNQQLLLNDVTEEQQDPLTDPARNTCAYYEGPMAADRSNWIGNFGIYYAGDAPRFDASLEVVEEEIQSEPIQLVVGPETASTRGFSLRWERYVYQLVLETHRVEQQPITVDWQAAMAGLADRLLTALGEAGPGLDPIPPGSAPPGASQLPTGCTHLDSGDLRDVLTPQDITHQRSEYPGQPQRTICQFFLGHETIDSTPTWFANLRTFYAADLPDDWQASLVLSKEQIAGRMVTFNFGCPVPRSQASCDPNEYGFSFTDGEFGYVFRAEPDLVTTTLTDDWPAALRELAQRLIDSIDAAR